MIRVLLVDDEQPSRERLRRLLGGFDDVEIVGEAEDGESALESIAELEPQLVFLDIQMPGCSGMEVAASLRAPRPQIVFCTAYDEYAVDAFELHAVDYLLKPVNRARLEKALQRVRAGTGEEARERSLDEAGAAAGAYPARYLGQRGKRFHVVAAERVLFFASKGGLTRLQTEQQHFWMQPTLTELERRLDPASFFRVSRAAIVRLGAIDEVVPAPGGQGEVKLSDGSRLEVSRRRLKQLMERLARG